MNISRNELRKMILEALGDRGDLPRKKQYSIGMRGPEDLPYSKSGESFLGKAGIAPHIAQKAQEIGNGYIIDVGAMEGSGGGNYPGYVVENGLASLDKEHVRTFEEYVFLLSDYGKNSVHIYPDQEEYLADFDQPIVNPLQNKPEDDNPVGGYFRPRA